MPFNSYIDARNFTSPKELARFLIDIGNDEEKYSSYFEWKEKYTSVETSDNYLCDLCVKLESTPIGVKSIKKGLFHWWYEKGNCHA